MTLEARISFREMVQVEDDSYLFTIVCEQTGIPYWPLIRNIFLRCIMSELFYDNPVSSMGNAHRPSAAAVATLMKASLHNLVSRTSAPGGLCIMASGMGLQLKDGRWFNRLCDHFAFANKDNTLVVEDRFGWNWPFPRHFERVRFHAPYQVAGEMAGRILVRDIHRKKAATAIDIVTERAKQYFNWSPSAPQIACMVTNLARCAAAMPYMYSTYQRLMCQTGAKLLLKEEACYGQSIVSVAAAKSIGMHVAEYQHGSISSGHDAYNFAPAAIASEELRRCLPDTFLSYGEWWGSQINAPIRKIVIGNPHRDAMVAQIEKPQIKPNLLILGDGIDTQLYIELAKELARLVMDTSLKVVFRPHPFERAAVEAKYRNLPGVEIDMNGDIYRSLAYARAVVSEGSTALFEAVGLSDNIFVWDTPKSRFTLPGHPFTTVNGADEIAFYLKQGADESSTPAVDGIWAGGWKDRYLSFIESQGIPVRNQ